MSYITAAEVKTIARITYDQIGLATDAAYTTFLTNELIPHATDLIDNHVGHDFLLTTGTIRLDGSGKETQHVNRFGSVIVGGTTSYPQLLPLPLTFVGTIVIDGVTQTLANFQIYKTYVTHENNYFASGRQNVDLVATWGYGTVSGDVPEDIKYITGQVCANALRNMLKRWIAPQEITRIIMGGRSTGGMRGFYAEDISLTDGLKERLNRYRFTDVGVG